MMGTQEAPARLFYDFNLEAHVPADHILREIDRFLDVGTIRQQLARHFSHLNLAYRWFCCLDLNSTVPDHSTFSKYRHGKFRDSDLLRTVFEATVARFISEGLVGGHGFAVDASLIGAVVDRMNSKAQAEWDISAIDPDDAPGAVKEYLDVLDDKAFGASTPIKPKFTSHSDPASQWTAARKGPAIFTYSNNYLIDTEHSVIVDVEATRSIRQAEVGAAQTMIDRTEERFGNKPDWLVADTAYGSAVSLPTPCLFVDSIWSTRFEEVGRGEVLLLSHIVAHVWYTSGD